MRKRRYFVIVCLICAIIAIPKVTATLSWLSSTSEPVVNTFSGGSIAIKLDEALVGADGKAIEGQGAKRVTENNYKYVAGAVLDKDPTPTVIKGSEKCYVFLFVENELNDKFTVNYDEVSWLKVAQEGGKTLYAYSVKVDALEATEDMVLKPIFTTITIDSELTSEDIADLGQRKLSVTAYAVQTDSISDKAAIDLAVAQFMPNGAVTSYPDIV